MLPARPIRFVVVASTLALVVGMGLGGASGTAATSTTVVGATVPSATQLDHATCRTGMTGVTEFGSVLPGSSAVTSAGCTITFGSSNDTSRLRIRQFDGVGQAMGSTPTGALDGDFSGDGVGRWDHPTGGFGDSAYATVPDAQGRLLIVGETWGGIPGGIGMARLLPDGSLDATFDGTTNGDGLVHDALCNCELQDVALDGKGRILTVARWPAADDDLAILRYTEAGVRDTTFNGTGYQRIQAGAINDELHAMHLTDGDEVVAAGRSGTGIVLVRTRRDGQLDANFDGDGVRLLELGAGSEKVVDLVEMPDGNLAALVLRGAIVEVLKFDPVTGATITGWGASGISTLGTTNFFVGTWSEPSFDLDGQGRLVVATNHDAGPENDLAIARITSGGAPDASWGTGGYRTYDLGADEGSTGLGLVLHGDGSVTLATKTDAGTQAQFVRVGASGALDTTFGSGGVRVVTELADDRVAARVAHRDRRHERGCVRRGAARLDDDPRLARHVGDARVRCMPRGHERGGDHVDRGGPGQLHDCRHGDVEPGTGRFDERRRDCGRGLRDGHAALRDEGGVEPGAWSL